MTKPRDLRSLEDADLDHRLGEARRELFILRFQLATGQLDNVARLSVLRREIARLITIESERRAGHVAEEAS